MAQQYTQEQIDKILQNLPEELHEAVFSMETADAIWNACTKQNILDEKLSKTAKHAGYVLMGLALPQEFEQILQGDIGIEKKAAQEIAREINRFVFYPVRSALEQLHGTQAAASQKSKVASTKPSQTLPEQEEHEEPQEQPQQPKGPDTYRESLDEE